MRFLKIFSLLTVVAVLLYLVCFAADGSVYNDVVRMHVIANSDSEADQSLKLEVRDLVLEKYSTVLSGYESKDAALTAAKQMLPEIETDVNAYLACRADYTCTVNIEESYFPTKSYGDYSLPRGKYTALCIRLGKAEGQNFWCVLYPPLCLGASSAEDSEELFLNCGLTEDEYELMRTEKPVYKVKFRILELLRGEG
ncbi:MAG: stage II sporulation protein R [Clostridia bacterium]|nr:stage II sporulation protein R [Clostridia bacterium]